MPYARVEYFRRSFTGRNEHLLRITQLLRDLAGAGPSPPFAETDEDLPGRLDGRPRLSRSLFPWSAATVPFLPLWDYVRAHPRRSRPLDIVEMRPRWRQSEPFAV